MIKLRIATMWISLVILLFSINSIRSGDTLDTEDELELDDTYTDWLRDNNITSLAGKKMQEFKDSEDKERLMEYREKLHQEELAKKREQERVAKGKREKELAEKKAKEEREKRVEMASRGSVKRVPYNNTDRKTYMCYTKITSTSSPQYKLQRTGSVHTDSEGFRKIGDRFMVAVGTHFTDKVGTKVQVKLKNGTVFNAVVGDIKSDAHTGANNIKHRVDGSVVEFIVDVSRLNGTIRKMGDCSYSSNNNFKGDVESITVVD